MIYMIPYVVGKLALNLLHLTRGLVKYVYGRGYLRVVPSQNGEKYVTSPPPPQLLNWSVIDCVANFCFGTPGLFMQACACVALSGWQVKNSRVGK